MLKLQIFWLCDITGGNALTSWDPVEDDYKVLFFIVQTTSPFYFEICDFEIISLEFTRKFEEYD